MVISSFSPLTSAHLCPHLFLFHDKSSPRAPPPRRRGAPRTSLFARSGDLSGRNAVISSSISQDPPRSLFPGGYKRPEIRVPNLVLRLSSDDLARDEKAVIDLVDDAVSDRVGIVVLTGGEGSGKRLYEAACLLKSVIGDRAYLLIDERVDIAAAVGANGVVLSDQGLPTIVARNTMMDARTDSVMLPLVARNVQTYDAALDASVSEGADFLIFTLKGGDSPDELVSSISGSIKIPIFIMVDSPKDEMPLHSLNSGASGAVVSVDELKLLREHGSSKLFDSEYASNTKVDNIGQSFENIKTIDTQNGFYGKKMIGGFTRLEEREQQLLEKERTILIEATSVMERAAPLMGDISLLKDAVSQLDEPFSMVIVGEFNSGKSSVINALLGQRYLKDGVIPTTNEITFLRYDESEFSEQRCERHPDGQYICYIPAPILKEMIIVDTPGTNVILQRQQRLTEEFVPRADLLIFVMSADRPLTESEVAFLRYIQQWKKKVVFVLNKSDLYLSADELEEAVAFIKENIQNMLSADHVTLYPVSARSTLEAKVSAPHGLEQQEQLSNTPYPGANNFSSFEKYLFSFLDTSTDNGITRIKLKLETPVKISERLLSACQKLVSEERHKAEEDLVFVNDLLSSVEEYTLQLESQSISWKKQILSLIDNTQARAIKLAESTLQLSNLDLVASFVLSGDKSAKVSMTLSLRSEIIDPAASEAKKLLGEYATWLESSNARKGNLYKESFEKRWPSVVRSTSQLEASELLRAKHELGGAVIRDFSAAAASKLFEQEIREALLGTFGGLGAAGLSASLLTSVLPTTQEDLLALGLCSAGGLLAVSNFPSRRRKVVDKVKRTANALARELEEAMQKDLTEATSRLSNFVTLIGKPYEEAAQDRLNKLLATEQELAAMQKKLETLQIEIQNFHVPR
ncbi:putative transmembrane GTPase FZO-like, chloroplastic [Salvia divinorum]|uniref:Transmembrane GTPase FZO-like, chloroplastic n=1 Tax=Salvia divinorum TaxID=28513 RepID=A0ABD1GU24_SALDI